MSFMQTTQAEYGLRLKSQVIRQRHPIRWILIQMMIFISHYSIRLFCGIERFQALTMVRKMLHLRRLVILITFHYLLILKVLHICHIMLYPVLKMMDACIMQHLM